MVKFPKHNASGCPDPTAHDALLPIAQADAALEARTTRLIKALKTMIDLAGYDLVARIEYATEKAGRYSDNRARKGMEHEKEPSDRRGPAGCDPGKVHGLQRQSAERS